MTTIHNTRPAGALLGLHAQTALHPGAGTALGTVDLPVQRERHTHWPTVAGSALKGVLRDACRTSLAGGGGLDAEDLVGLEGKDWSPRQRADNTVTLAALFGPATADSSEFAGALGVTDARLLAFPVRSLRGVFAWTTCPAALERLQRDADLAGLALPAESFSIGDNKAIVAPDCPCLVEDRLVLEEFEFTREARHLSPQLAEWLARTLLPDTAAYVPTRTRFKKQLVVLSDNDFTHFARHATEVCARVGLNYETKTVKDGALFYQEFLPTETLFYAVVLANPARARQRRDADGAAMLAQLRGFLPPVLQVGGDESTGKGHCAVRLSAGGKS
jgi:CRISPR-associated protein Cmr4